MNIESGGQVEFDVGVYKGDLNHQGLPHGQGRLDYKDNDSMGRKYYEGQWEEGKNTGQGKVDYVYIFCCFENPLLFVRKFSTFQQSLMDKTPKHENRHYKSVSKYDDEIFHKLSLLLPYRM